MHCPFCRYPDSRVIDSRTSEDGASTRRRRQCPECSKRFTTVETAALTVTKRCGSQEAFNREKVIRGVRRACQGRPVTEDQLAVLAHQVEDQIRATGVAEVDSHQVGLEVLGPLRDLDEVAYLRFASVYHSYDSIEDFLTEIAALQAAQNSEEEKQL
ncbi:MAG: transcriptional regulator NrdR [Bifidobacteriaceae bacterium]|nr:transcriptional regulator NrdR [Bifidobacteriaceae bacterium]